ncbi:heat shock protein Hsp88 [Rhizoctonia solani AG-1 IA]|uniref:Heat shock protein Hsp88 n=1 Tax=Thanatephorus cucumeris (strain AG1-IA) TaxID=983506 RepID=L8X067_THACA|nr:heat shock protein Hsp88 [Rhizoctonia solani AG-1 IA]
MPRGHKMKKGRGGRGDHQHTHHDFDFDDDFTTVYDTVAARGHRGRGSARGVFNHMSSVFIPAATRAVPRGASRGSAPSTPARGRGSPTPRGRGDFQPRGRGGPMFRGGTRGNNIPRGRGRGYGYVDRGYASGAEYQSRLLEPIKFVAAESTPRFLFEEDAAEDIFKAEVVDLAQGMSVYSPPLWKSTNYSTGDGAPTADVVEAAFSTQLEDLRGSEEDTAEGESDFRPQASDQSEHIANNPQRQWSSTGTPFRELPKLDIASAVSLATRLKDAALTPREETFRSATPKPEPPINRNGAATPILSAPITEPDSDSASDSEDVVLFVPTPQTPARPLTPLPLLSTPVQGPAYMLAVSPSPMRPSPLSSSFSPPVYEEQDPKLEPVAEVPKPEPPAKKFDELVPEIILSEVEPQPGHDVEPTTIEPIPAGPAPETDILVVNFEDLSSVMFVDTTPTPVTDIPVRDETLPQGTIYERALGVEPARSPDPTRLHGMEIGSSSQHVTQNTIHGSPAVKQVTISTTQTITETVLSVPDAATPRPATPNFHNMTFKFTPRSTASRDRARARKLPNYHGHRGLGYKFSGKPRVPREGDSDLDWGDNGPPKPEDLLESTSDKESDDDPGMVEDISSADMLNFLKNIEGREWVTMDDINDEQMLRQEDDDDELEVDSEDDSEDEDDLDRALAEAEGDIIESDDDIIAHMVDEDDSDDSDDIDESFRTRLNRLRENTPSRGKNGKKGKKGKKKGKGKARMVDDDSSDDDDFMLPTRGFSKADADEEFLAAIEDQFVGEMFLKRERKRGMISPPLSREYQPGDVAMDLLNVRAIAASRKKNLPPELQAQWERDRQKKAENKRLRAVQRQASALEKAPKRGAGSKASFLFNSNTLTLSVVESRLRSFVANLAQKTMALPAMDKESRRRVHLLAECFTIKTVSKGKGVGRYITLTRTSRTGININENKIRRLVNADNEAIGGGVAEFNKAFYRRVDDGPAKSRIKTHDGEIIGHRAAKIGEDNVGHKLLSKMGWSEGDRIGMSGGLADPLQAIMKRSKLGLGASVVGIDFGNLASKIGVARKGGIDVIVNETSNRATPSLVSFGVKARAMGEAAKTLETSNFKNTVGSLKRLIGRSLSEPEINDVEKQYLNAQLVDVNGTVGVKVNYLGEPTTFSATQLVAMYLGKLRDITSAEIKATPSDVVISVPGWYNDTQRRAVLDAAHIAGLNPLRLINDTTAIALGYGITKSDLPEPDSPRNVVFVDIGHSNYSVAVVAFAKGQLSVKSTAYERNFGGRNIDLVLVKHFAAEFKEKYKIDVMSSPKAVFRLITACEKLKKVLSANAEAPLNVESLMNDVDASSKMTRDQFEELLAEPLSLITVPLEEALLEAGLTPDQVHSIELVGGSTRIPAIRTRIRDYFGSDRQLSATLNADEAVCRGATFACAMLSPVFRVREFTVQDITPYPIKTSWERAPGDAEEDDTELVVFSRGNNIPSTKVLTFYRSAPFELEASYAEPNKVHGQAKIGSFKCNNVAPGANGDPAQIKVKTRLNLHGILSFEGAQLIEEEIVDPEPLPEGAEGEPPKPKKLVKKTDLPVSTKYNSLEPAVLEKYRESELSMHAADKLVADTEDRKNALEEYVYDMRGKLDERLAPFVLPEEKAKILDLAQKAEDWLYSEEGEDASKSAYVERLDALHALGDPVTTRYREWEARPRAAAQLRETIGSYMERVNQPDFAHIDEAERNKVVERCATEQQWLDDKSARQLERPKTSDPILTSAEILKHRDELIYFATPILTKPKPKPQTTETPQGTGTPQPQSGAQSGTQTPNPDAKKEPSEMEVD